MNVQEMRLPEIKHLATKTVLAIQPEVNIPGMVTVFELGVNLDAPASHAKLRGTVGFVC